MKYKEKTKEINITGCDDLHGLLKSEGIELQDDIAAINPVDFDINGGRKIKNVKSNQLFTGRFEKKDVDDFISVWKLYRRNRDIKALKKHLNDLSDKMIINYRSEVSPIEVMLYASNVIRSDFTKSSYRLVEIIAEVILYIWNNNCNFFQSLKHIVYVWKWNHIRNICAVAVGKICAKTPNDKESYELMQYINDRFGCDEENRVYCFFGIIETRNDSFIPDILNVVHVLGGRDTDDTNDYIIGSLFKQRFNTNFSCIDGLDVTMFDDASPYVKKLIRVVLGDNNTIIRRYNNANNETEKNKIIQEGISLVINGNDKGVYAAVHFLTTLNNDKISEQLFAVLENPNNQGKTLRPIITYFGIVYYKNAIDYMHGIGKNNDLYPNCKVSLYKLKEVSSKDLIGEYLNEHNPKRIESYLKRFNDVRDKQKEIRDSALSFFNEELEYDVLSNAMSNYKRLVNQNKGFFNHLIGEIIKELFGFNTYTGKPKIRLNEMTTCLDIIDMVIDSSNRDRYDEFLYYVSEQAPSEVTSVISVRAREILIKHGIEDLGL